MPLTQVKEIVKRVNDFNDSEITTDVQLQFRLEIVKRWSTILDNQAATNRSKAVGVTLAQTVLTISISLIGLR